MVKPTDALVAHLLESGLISAEDVPMLTDLAQQVYDAPGVAFDEHDVLGVTQALGRAVERVAAAGADMAMRQLDLLPPEEREAALEAWLATVIPIATTTFGVLCDRRAHQIAHRRLTAWARDNDASPPLTVAFVDLRGSTAFMLRSEPREIEALADELYVVGQTVATRHDVAAGKFLGDGVLLISADPGRLLQAARDAVVELGDRTPLRAAAGVARGPVIRRAGDWHGPPVNLAARLAEIAQPDEILADTSVMEDEDAEPDRWLEVRPRDLPDSRRVASFLVA